MNILILEDNIERQKQFTQNLIGHHVVIKDNVKDATEELRKEKFDLLFLDHDLGGQVLVPSGEETGWMVTKFLSDNPQYKPQYIILHSLNDTERKNMKSLIPDAIEIPFAWTESNLRSVGLI